MVFPIDNVLCLAQQVKYIEYGLFFPSQICHTHGHVTCDIFNAGLSLIVQGYISLHVTSILTCFTTSFLA